MPNPAPLTGLAIGDALGMPFETDGPMSPRLMEWDGTYQSSSYHHLGPGQWTDDTQMSLALATSLLERKFYDPETAAKAYLAWFLSDDCRGIGRSTRIAMQQLAKGMPWYESGLLDAEGNGSAMRATPIGLFHHRGIERLRSAAHWARLDSAITHRSEDAKEGAAAVAVAISHLASGGAKKDVLDAVIAHTEKSRLRFAIEDLQRDLRFEMPFKDILMSRGWILGGVGAHVVQTVPAALAIFEFSESFEETITNAIRLGGDTDTTAAIAGALAGAWYGYEAIPKRLLDGLENQPHIRNIELQLIGPTVKGEPAFRRLLHDDE